MNKPNMQTPRQARSMQTLNKVLDACDALLAQRTFEQISMQDIAREAGVSVGNLYNRFSDKDALIDHIIERQQLEFRDHMGAAFAERDATLGLKARVDVVADAFHTGLQNLRPIFATLVVRRLQGVSPSEPMVEGTDSIVEMAAEWLCLSSDEIAGDEMEKARFAIASLAFGLQFDLVMETASRVFGESYLKQAKAQAYCYLIYDEE